MKIDIPGSDSLHIKYLVLDFNGTIATDGVLDEGLAHRIQALASMGLEIHVITADTNGTAEAQCAGLPAQIHLFPKDQVALEKARLGRVLGKAHAACLGNGKNDLLMVEEAALSIVIIGREGAYAKTALVADLWVFTSIDGLDLLLKPHRLIASLRS